MNHSGSKIIRIGKGFFPLLISLILLSAYVPAVCQEKNAIPVSGIVLDETDTPMPGANVFVKGTNKCVTTDVDGSFTFPWAREGQKITFSFVGYKDYQLIVRAGLGKQEIKLEPNNELLDELVVVPYGTAVAKKDLTGSVATVNIADMKALQTTTFENAIAGKVAGLQVNVGDGQPGGLPDIVIRGNNSVTQSNAPLYVVDGIPLESPDNSSIPTQNIKSIEVLKDASATAIYGARGANGVIVITTDSGSQGDPKVSMEYRFSIQKDYKRYEMMSPYEFVKLQNELDQAYGSMYLSGREPHADGSAWTLEDYRNVEPIDWQDKISRTGMLHEYNVSVSGGSEKSTYMVSFNYANQKGIILNTGMTNYVGSMNLTQKIGRRMDLVVRANYAEKKRTGLQVNYGQGSSAYMYKVWSYRPISTNGVDLTHELEDPERPASGVPMFNPLIQTENTDQTYITRQLRSSAVFSWNIIDDLKFSTSISYTRTDSQTDIFNNSKTEAGSTLPGRNDGINGSRRNALTSNVLNENTLNYRKKINGIHDLAITAGYTQQKNIQDINEIKATQIPETSEWRGIEALDEGLSQKIMSKKKVEWAMQSAIFRTNYNYARKYYATFTFRADGSSKFSKDNRWGKFYSGALRWRFAEEKFVSKNIGHWLSDGSLNISYGSTGNNGIGEYAYLPQMGFSAGGTYYDYSFNDQYPTQGVIVSSIGNSKLKWETTYTLNARLDLAFLNNRINFTTEYYWKDTKDLLINATLPAHIGYANAYRNIGRVENKGFEFSLSTINFQNRNFRWSTDFNISFNRNKVLALANNQSVLPADNLKIPNGAALYIAKVGQPIGMMYGAITDGLYQYEDFRKGSDGTWILRDDVVAQSTNANRKGVLPGYQKFKDLNGDLQITQEDLTVIGNPNPDFTGGFTNSFAWRDFDLSVFFTFSYGNDILNMNRYYLEEGRSLSSNQFASYADRWTVDNPDGTLPRVRSANNTAWSSDRYVEDGSYLRLKNVNFGYTLPAKISRRFYVSSLRLYFSAQNIFTITKYSGQDPTVSTMSNARTPGYDYSAYPVPRTFIVGAQLSF